MQKWQGVGVANDLKYDKYGISMVKIPKGVKDDKARDSYNKKMYDAIMKSLNRYDNEKKSYPEYYELIKRRMLEGYERNSIGDGSDFRIGYFGGCGGYFELASIWIIIPVFVIPSFQTNKCEKYGLDGFNKDYLDMLNVSVEMRYNGILYHPYNDNGLLKFKIENFKKFKEAEDKAIIIKKNDFSRIIPFEWKVKYSSMGGIILHGYEY